VMEGGDTGGYSLPGWASWVVVVVVEEGGCCLLTPMVHRIY